MITPIQFLNTSSVVSSKHLRTINIFWVGFILYTLGNALASTAHLSIVICQAVQIPGFLLMIAAIVSLIRFKFDSPFLRLIYVLYCTWLITMIFQGLSFLADYNYLKNFLFNPYIGMLYLAPIVLLFPRNFVFYKKVFDVIAILGIFYIICDILFIKDLLNSDRESLTSQGIVETFSDLSFSSGFILLTYSYHTKKRQLLAMATIGLALLIAIIRARRGLIFMYANMIMISYILYILRSKMKLLIIYLTLFTALLGAVYVTSIYKPHESRLFGFLLERGNENTRERVELMFYDDMKTKDWIIGRGIKGEYFCPDVEEHQLTNYRPDIETGYEQTILKGGLISLGLFLLIAVPAMLKGLFQSKNILSKVAGIWIFMSLINSYPGTTNAFTLQYLIVWISIGICYSKKIRNLPEKALKNYFQTVST